MTLLLYIVFTIVQNMLNVIKFTIKFWVINNFMITIIKKSCDFFFNLIFLVLNKIDLNRY